MSKLSAIQKQIAALQAKAERITKQEMSAAVAKVKGLMSDFGVTIEHLTQSVVGKSTAKKASTGKTAKSPKKTASVAKYADPASGKTWSGFGRAPGWIAGAKNREDFLVGAVKAMVKPAPSKKTLTKAAATGAKRLKAVAKPTAKKTTAPKAAAKKKNATPSSAVEKAATKPAVKAKASAKKAAARKAVAKASTSAPVESTPTGA